MANIDDLSFTTLFLNSFGMAPTDAGVEVAGGRGTRNGHTIELAQVDDRLIGWQVDGQQLLGFRLLNRSDPRATGNLEALHNATA